MSEEHTTAVIQRCLADLGEAPAQEEAIRTLLAQAAGRLHQLCGGLLHRNYPRLTKSPLCLEPDELLSSVVERLLKALREVRPSGVREFFALANQHIRWELNDLARRLDEQPPLRELPEGLAAAADSTGTGLTVNSRRILEAIDGLPDDEREAFDLVRIQGLPQSEVAELLGVAPKTVQRRVQRALVLLAERLHDLAPP
jgi:RNA polymerase sigma factor (sigma-70 family)